MPHIQITDFIYL